MSWRIEKACILFLRPETQAALQRSPRLIPSAPLQLNSQPRDVVEQSCIPQAFPVGHIHPVGGGQLLEGGGQRSTAILRAAEGKVDGGTRPLPAQRPGAIELQPVDLR